MCRALELGRLTSNVDLHVNKLLGVEVRKLMTNVEHMRDADTLQQGRILCTFSVADEYVPRNLAVFLSAFVDLP